MCTKRYLHFWRTFFPCIPSSQILKQKKIWTKMLFSLWIMQLEDFAIAWSIDNFFAHYFSLLYFKYAYKKWRVSSKNLQNFNCILRKILRETFFWILFRWMQNLKLSKNYLIPKVDLLCSSWEFKQSCFLNHFSSIFS